MLLRLRQICVHPALIQESCEALVASNELTSKRDLQAERARAARLVSIQFVSKLMTQYKEAAMARVLAEREVSEDCLVRTLVDTTLCSVCGRSRRC